MKCLHFEKVYISLSNRSTSDGETDKHTMAQTNQIHYDPFKVIGYFVVIMIAVILVCSLIEFIEQ